MDKRGVPHVVIIGGGFGGLFAARALGSKPVRVTIIDRANYHLFQPLLYQVAAATLSPGDIAMPLRSIFRNRPNVEVLKAEVKAVDPVGQKISFEGGGMDYDYVIVAAGVRHSYFGHDEWEEYAPGIKNIDDAFKVRRAVLIAYEQAELALDPREREELLTFVIVGGGPTGVELAGALAEMSRLAMVDEFRRIDPAESRIILLEASDRILPGFPRELSERARISLVKKGVDVRVGSPVTRVTRSSVDVKGEVLRTRTIIWAAGVAASPLGRSLGAPLDKAGRVIVEPDLSIPGHNNVFVIGDMAAFRKPDGSILPGVCQAAMQQGAAAASNILRLIRSRPTREFRYLDKGTMVVIGRTSAVVDMGRIRISGAPAWFVWCFIHILFLIGFRNRFIVMFQWAWDYFTFQKGERLILCEKSDSDRNPA